MPFLETFPKKLGRASGVFTHHGWFWQRLSEGLSWGCRRGEIQLEAGEADFRVANVVPNYMEVSIAMGVPLVIIHFERDVPYTFLPWILGYPHGELEAPICFFYMSFVVSSICPDL